MSIKKYKGRIQNNIEGFTLIEVIVFVGLISIIFVTGLALMTTSIRDSKINQHRIIASNYAQNLQETIRAEKEIDWITFSSKALQGDGNSYCFNTENITISTWPEIGECVSYSLDNLYKRTLTLTGNPDGSGVVNAKIKVEWVDAGNNYIVVNQTSYNRWEE